MTAFAVSFLDITCRLDAPEQVAREWAAMTEPFFTVAGGPPPRADLLVEVEIGPRPRPAPDGVPVLLHGDLKGRVRRDAGDRWVVSSELATYTVVAGRPPRVLAAYEQGAPVALDALRVVRGLLTALAESRGLGKVHAACVDAGGVGIALVGDVGAGKTSFALTGLRAGSNFVANDKLLVDRHGRAHGLPLAVAIAVESLADLGCELPAEARVIDGKWYEWPARVATLCGTACSTSTTIDVVVVCELDLSARRVAALPVTANERARLLTGPVALFSDRIHPSWLAELLDLRPAPAQPSIPPAASWVRLRGNPWREDWLDRVLLPAAAAS